MSSDFSTWELVWKVPFALVTWYVVIRIAGIAWWSSYFGVSERKSIKNNLYKEEEKKDGK